MERVNYLVEELVRNLADYLDDLQRFMQRHELADILADPIVDHVAVKAKDGRHYEQLVERFARDAKNASFIVMSGRRIATIELNGSILFLGLGEVDYIEVMEPKPEKIGRDLVGLEHIEIYNPDFGTIRRRLESARVTYEWADNGNHQTIVIKINEKGQEVKFTNGRLGEIARRQTEDGIGVVVKSSGGAEQ